MVDWVDLIWFSTPTENRPLKKNVLNLLKIWSAKIFGLRNLCWTYPEEKISASNLEKPKTESNLEKPWFGVHIKRPISLEPQKIETLIVAFCSKSWS